MGIFRRPLILAVCVSWTLGACVTVEPSEFETGKGSPKGKILIKGPGTYEKDPSSQACADFVLNEEQVRQRFQTYRRLSKKDLQEKYAWAPCFVEGLIETPKAVFSWRIREGNTLETNYPSGKPVVLGGPPSATRR